MEKKIREAAQKATLTNPRNDEFFQTLSQSEIKELLLGFKSIKGENENYVFRSLMTEKFPRFKKENYISKKTKRNEKNFMAWLKLNLKENSGAVLLKAFYKEYMERKQFISNLEAKLEKLESAQIKRLYVDVDRYLKEYMPNVSTDIPLNIDQPQTMITMLSELPFQAFRAARRFVDNVTLKKPDLLYGKMIQFPVKIVSANAQICYSYSMFRRFFAPFVCLPEDENSIELKVSKDGTFVPRSKSNGPESLSKWVLGPCEARLRAFAISTFPVDSNSGHILIAIYNQELNEVEVFDSGGNRYCDLYQKIIQKVFLGTNVMPKIICANPYDLQKKKTDNGLDNNFCQTFIYWFLYNKAVLKRKTKDVVEELHNKSVDARFQLMQSFGQYIYNLGNQSTTGSVETKQQWIDWFEKLQKRLKNPVLPFLFSLDIFTREDKMQLYKCMSLDVSLDKLSKSTKVTELTSCYIDVYLSKVTQKRFHDIKKIFETKQQWIDLFENLDKQLKRPILPLLFSLNIFTPENQMEVYKCIFKHEDEDKLQIYYKSMDLLPKSTKLKEITLCYIDVYLSKLPQERFNDTKKILEKYVSWDKWFQEMKTRSIQQDFTLFTMKKPSFDFSDWTPETVQKEFFKNNLSVNDLQEKWNQFLKWQKDTKEMQDRSTDKELVKYIKAKITKRLISEKEKDEFQNVVFGLYEEDKFTTILPYLDKDAKKEDYDLSVLNAILVSLDVLE